MFRTAEWTVVALKRHLKEHGLSTSGKKEVLRGRCERHSARCACSNKVESTVEPEAASEQISLNDILNTIKWTSSLHDCPPLGHSSIVAYKASDKHMKQGYNLFKNDKVENMLVGRDDAGDYYCKGRVSPSMKKHRYVTSVKVIGTLVSDSDCSCPAGKGKCKHAMALLYALIDLIILGSKEIPESMACTSQPRQWGRISCRPVVSAVANFSELVPKVVCHDPENPEAAINQAARAENQLLFNCLPAGAEPIGPTRQNIMLSCHPFWGEIIAENNPPETNPPETTSLVETKPLINPCVNRTATFSTPTPTIQTTLSAFVNQPTQSTDNDIGMTIDIHTNLPVYTGASTSASVDITAQLVKEWNLDSDLLFTPETEHQVQVTDYIPVDLPLDTGPSTSASASSDQPLELEDYERYRHDVEVSTRGQADNQAWQKVRLGKITASIIGTIYTLRTSTNPQHIIAQINQTKITDLSNIPAIKHGRQFEQSAKVYYEKWKNVKINDRGFMLHPKYPWLGASTDGYIDDPPTAVEIKCPLAEDDSQAIEDLACSRKNWFLDTDGFDLWLRPNHKYYYQCQLQMECLGVEVCLFIVYLCNKDGIFQDIFVEEIKKDQKVVSNLVIKANQFYTKHLKV